MEKKPFLTSDELTGYKNMKRSKPGDVYILDEALSDAVRVALMLDQPLLITGEPGTGKTTLAAKIAKELHSLDNTFHEVPLFFSTKSTTVANDLFYSYDAITHFYDANIAKRSTSPATENHNHKEVTEYISLQALGKAILAGHRNVLTDKALLDQLPTATEKKPDPTNFVVVIDEIDKAPRDFPNDILHEIETYSFKIKESKTSDYIKAEHAKIFVIMTSNSERALPDAFLRRCIFFHIDFPSNDRLKEILTAHSNDGAIYPPLTEDFKKDAVDLFSQYYQKCVDKKPSTAELINWVRYLNQKRFDFKKPNLSILKNASSIVAKTRNDLNLIMDSGDFS